MECRCVDSGTVKENRYSIAFLFPPHPVVMGFRGGEFWGDGISPGPLSPITTRKSNILPP